MLRGEITPREVAGYLYNILKTVHEPPGSSLGAPLEGLEQRDDESLNSLAEICRLDTYQVYLDSLYSTTIFVTNLLRYFISSALLW